MLRVSPEKECKNLIAKPYIKDLIPKPDLSSKPNDNLEETKPTFALNPDSLDDAAMKPIFKCEARSESVDSGKQHVPDGESAHNPPPRTEHIALFSIITSPSLIRLRDQNDDVRTTPPRFWITLTTLANNVELIT
ncbi:hypothetical protein PCANC_06591 [Puccinia coronata f. sp. avenae]|uniref:Uncharacterized protein n=1 Tax=Puccinia coronata f. sp. avenae TaxID=200324 RepID=A0A2N5U665_9BASI|nr:hypothetical protein PCASD_09497 [Puccinia coronata f. sp. avenae]PLW46875.1 hypothetical protein PCANC_06591 [Puccinia coronata f. sp. avenae]